MKYQIKPEQVHVVVFLFFVLAAGCKGVSEYACERLEARSAGLEQVDQLSAPKLDISHICANGNENCSDLEILGA